MQREFRGILKSHPVIASVKDLEGLEAALESPARIIFVLFSDIISLPSIIRRAKSKDKLVFVHLDLVEGLDNKEVSAKYVKQFTEADGIISTKHNVIQAAKEQGLLTIQRFFMLDSMALVKAMKHMDQGCADAIEILPGVIPKTIRKVSAFARVPVIAGGLIMDREDVNMALTAGASAISTTNRILWNL